MAGPVSYEGDIQAHVRGLYVLTLSSCIWTGMSPPGFTRLALPQWGGRLAHRWEGDARTGYAVWLHVMAHPEQRAWVLAPGFFSFARGGSHSRPQAVHRQARTRCQYRVQVPSPPLPQLEAWSSPVATSMFTSRAKAVNVSPADRSLTNRKWILSPVDPRLTPRRKPPSPNRDDRYMEERE